MRFYYKFCYWLRCKTGRGDCSKCHKADMQYQLALNSHYHWCPVCKWVEFGR